MKRLPATSFAGVICAIAAASQLASCADGPVRNEPPAVHRVSGRITQMGYGNDASFVQCTDSQCPSRTPKTLALLKVSETGRRPDIDRSGATDLAGAAPQSSHEGDADGPSATAPEQSSTPSAPSRSEPRYWTVPFAFGAAQIGPSGQQIVRQAAADIPPKGRLVLLGRTDNVGQVAANDELALKRSEAVQALLERLRGDLHDTITLQSRGACCYAASNGTAEGRARNRRVVIVLAPTAAH